MMTGMTSVFTVFVLVLCVNKLTGHVDQLTELPADLQHTFDVYRSMLSLDQQPGYMIYWSSLQQYICKFVKSRPDMTQAQATFFREKIREFTEPIFNLNSQRVKRQASQPSRRRREIRDMSIDQRRRYFNAVNALKNDRRLSPNIYDVLAAFHEGDRIQRAHSGPAFPAWHRLYLWLYESFLRLHDPTVTVPYWASVLDNEMDDPTLSVVWSDGFFGNGVGVVSSGPFADWGTINPATVFRRNVGSGPLYSYANVDTIVSKERNWQLLVPTAEADSNFEFLHGGPHVHVAGSMNRLDEAVRDPIFYSHHCFVDYIWEQFRLRQRQNGIDPETDYPFNASDSRFRASHSPTAMMGFFPNNELSIDYQNRVGYLNVFFDLVQYQPVPSCPDCGGSQYLYCDRNLAVPRCVSRARAGLRAGTFVDDLFADELTSPVTGRKRRAIGQSYASTCPRQPFMREVDSSRSPSGIQWAYIPVSIITKRPPTYPYFKDYSLYNYARQSQLQPSEAQFTRSGTQKGFDKCSRYEDSVGRVKLITYGINYDGTTEENVIVDNRLGLSQAYGFALVKAPTSGMPSDAIVGAFDSCGRVCRPYCLKGTKSMSKFSGGIRVTSERPLQYGVSYGDAMLESWKISPDSGSPETDGSNIPLTFYCDYTSDWIWSNQRTTFQQHGSSGGMNRSRSTDTVLQRPTSVRRGRPRTRTQQARRTTQINPYIGRSRTSCQLRNTNCRLDVACSPCTNWEERACIGSRYHALCINGVFELQHMYIGAQPRSG